ncbi:MAG TPA: peptidylprolyl isomerase [Synergistales bacterium]|nr:peptidylprolyl isomerase [Synergistales bacterium]HQO83789.1 peptidylprolyl isomerase [Synergistales bacterium]HQQ10920.1 peptidylprolyl isomerase [Synergistales bacterium]
MIRLKTSKGDILLEMFEEEAPKTVENFLNYVKAGHDDVPVEPVTIIKAMVEEEER